MAPTALVSDAHKAGLFVHTYTFRSETKYLAGKYNGDPVPEYLDFFRAGIDGVFSDFPDTAVAWLLGLDQELAWRVLGALGNCHWAELVEARAGWRIQTWNTSSAVASQAGSPPP